MATPIKPGKYYDVVEMEECDLFIESENDITLYYIASKRIKKYVTVQYVKQNLMDTNSLADTLFDDSEIE